MPFNDTYHSVYNAAMHSLVWALRNGVLHTSISRPAIRNITEPEFSVSVNPSATFEITLDDNSRYSVTITRQ